MKHPQLATASLREISEYAWRIVPKLSEYQQKSFAQQLRMRYRGFSFAELLGELIADVNGQISLHPIAKRALFRVMRQNVANMVGDVKQTVFGENAESISDIRPIPIKRKSETCLSVIEDVWDSSDVQFDVREVESVYNGILREMNGFLDRLHDASMQQIASVIFLEKHGVILPDANRSNAIANEIERRKQSVCDNIQDAPLDALGSFLSFNANDMVKLSKSDYNRIWTEVYNRVINMVRKVAGKYTNVYRHSSPDELCQDAISRVFVNIHSYCPSRACFSTWVWTTVDASLNAAYTDMLANKVMYESSLCSEEAENERRTLEQKANAETLRDYERRMLIQHIQSVANALIDKMPQHSHIIKAIFGDSNGVCVDDLDFDAIATRSSAYCGHEESSSYVKEVFENSIRPEAIRLFSN